MTDRELTALVNEIATLALSRELERFPEVREKTAAIAKRLEAHRDELRKCRTPYHQVAGDNGRH